MTRLNFWSNVEVMTLILGFHLEIGLIIRIICAAWFDVCEKSMLLQNPNLKGQKLNDVNYPEIWVIVVEPCDKTMTTTYAVRGLSSRTVVIPKVEVFTLH